VCKIAARPQLNADQAEGLASLLKEVGYLHVPEGRRDHTTSAETLRLHGLG
jgi:hypothetical protein